MITKQTQIKLSLPIDVKTFAKKKARKYGLTLAGYIRYLLINEIRVEEYPVYTPTERVERAVARARKAEKEGKLVRVDNMEEFFKKL